jgi:hypothetical protein
MKCLSFEIMVPPREGVLSILSTALPLEQNYLKTFANWMDLSKFTTFKCDADNKILIYLDCKKVFI